jgi:hypothetical protein
MASSRTGFRLMSRTSAILLLSLALAGCAAAPQARLASDPVFSPQRYAWDGAGEDPNQPRLASNPSRYSPVAAGSYEAQEGIEADQDARVSRSLVICRGCLPSQPTEDTRLAKASD